MQCMALDKGLLARSSPAGLAWFYSDGAWVFAPHLRYLSEKIVYAATHRNKRLIVTMPPRHGKSELISRFTPAWYLGTFPDRKIILATYSDQFSASWGRAAREVMEDVGKQLWGVEVNQEAKGGQHWELLPPSGQRSLRNGVMTTAGVGGGITGKGANLMIIDDPVKNAQDAQSKVVQEAQLAWWQSTARTRLQPGASVILVMTRWHENDLAGRLAASEDEEWELINFPAIAELPPDADAQHWNDALGRRAGEALWPEMYDLENLEATRRAMGNYWFGAMYQQRPAPAEGNLFKRDNLRYYDRDFANGILTLHHDDRDFHFNPGYGLIFQTVDCAGSSKETSDYTVVSTWAVTPQADLVWLDCEWVQFESLDIGGFVDRKFREWSPAIVGVERIGFGLTVIQELSRKGVPVVRLEPSTDKVSRCLSAVARTEEHRVFLPQNASWKDHAIEQLAGFPNAANDDIVDTVSYAGLMLPNMTVPAANGSAQKSNGETLVGNAIAMQL